MKKEEGKVCFVPYGVAACLIQGYADIKEQAKNYPFLEELPECKEALSLIKKGLPDEVQRNVPWENFEERRTVVGPDIDGISELSFRVAEGLPIRDIFIKM